jgi:glycosyltransferase involved in cell wall biosynthesis
MKPARIAILTSGHPCRNPRPVKEASALAAAGYDVTLITPDSDPRLAEIDAVLLANARFPHHAVPVPRTFSRRLKRWLAVRALSLGWESVQSLGDPTPLWEAVNSRKHDLVIVHNEVPHWIGVRLLKQGHRVVADIEDWHSEDLLPADRRHRPLRLLRKTERELLHQAIYTTTTSHALAEGLHATFGGNRPEVITNAFPLQPSPCRDNSGGEPRSPRFFWFSQTLGPGRGLEIFLDAWSLTREPSELVLLGRPTTGFDEALRARVPASHRGRIRFQPLVSPDELPAVIAAHDIGLALEDAAIRNRDLTITNKILQYLNAGLVIVATDTAGQREVLSRAPEAGVIFSSNNDAAGRAVQLDELLCDRVRLRSRQAAARRLAEEHYCWEREAPRLVALVEKALA